MNVSQMFQMYAVAQSLRWRLYEAYPQCEGCSILEDFCLGLHEGMLDIIEKDLCKDCDKHAEVATNGGFAAVLGRRVDERNTTP